ncbi:MAG: ABC transporter substrate-binding protein [Sphingomonadaceae bacterium]
MLTRRNLVLSAAVLALAGPVLAQDFPAEARRFVEAMIAELSGIEAREKNEEARRKAIDQALRQRVALDRIGRYMLGASRTKATAAELAEYDRLVPDFILADVRGEIAKLVAQSIAIDEVQARSERDALVRSRFRRRTGGTVRVDWRVGAAAAGGQPQLIDVFVNGVSRFAIRRDEFQAIVKARGMAGLIGELRAGVLTAA